MMWRSALLATVRDSESSPLVVMAMLPIVRPYQQLLTGPKALPPTQARPSRRETDARSPGWNGWNGCLEGSRLCAAVLLLTIVVGALRRYAFSPGLGQAYPTENYRQVANS